MKYRWTEEQQASLSFLLEILNVLFIFPPKNIRNLKKIDFVAIATEGDFIEPSIRTLPKLLKKPKSS